MMQAIMVSEPGGPDVLHVEEVDIPEPGPDEVLVRVMAAGVGPWDVGMRDGGWTGAYPYIPGGEFFGYVEGDTGEQAAFEDGAPVYGYPGLAGCYAQYVTCPSEQLAPVPAGLLDGAEAGAVPITAMTAEQGLTDVLDIRSGDTVLVTAAAGGLGHMAVQIARALGANVVATASPQHHDFAHKLGAEIVLDHTKPDWPDQLCSEVSGGVDKALACAAPTLAGAAKAAADGATIATPVYADDYPEGDRIHWARYNGKARGTSLIRMAPWFNDETVQVHIDRTYYWKDAAAAQQHVADGHTRGKVLLIVDDDLAAQMEV